MRTSKPISTISYNTPVFLSDTLERLRNDGFISFYAWIEHEPEKDERKKHIHLYVEPARMLDTLSFSKCFDELDNSNNLPLSVMPWQSSKYYDWYMYGLHDIQYLASRSMVRDFHYQKKDMFFSDVNYSDEILSTHQPDGKDLLFIFLNALQSGLSWNDLVYGGYVPLSRYIVLRKVYDDFSKSVTSRYSDNTDVINSLKIDRICSIYKEVDEKTPFD